MGLIESPGRPLMRWRADYTTYKQYLSRVAAGICATTSDGAFTPEPTGPLAPIRSVVQDATGPTRTRAPRAPRAPRKPRTGGEAA